MLKRMVRRKAQESATHPTFSSPHHTAFSAAAEGLTALAPPERGIVSFSSVVAPRSGMKAVVFPRIPGQENCFGIPGSNVAARLLQVKKL
jgi:hypothetical protein